MTKYKRIYAETAINDSDNYAVMTTYKDEHVEPFVKTRGTYDDCAAYVERNTSPDNNERYYVAEIIETTRLRVRIVSLWGLTDPGRGFTWEGVINVENDATADQINEKIFRRFNRVTDEDVRLLEQDGYTMPSLSVGDIVAHGPIEGEELRAFVVAIAGFTELRPGIGAGR
jgi:hypothetical protein